MTFGMRALLGPMAGAALALAAATGASADGGLKGAQYTAPAPFSWTGLYVGGAVGYGFGNSTLDGLLEGVSAELNLRGQQGIVTIGYDFQMGSRWVAGLFADFSLGGTGLSQLVAASIDNQWAIGGRLGVLATPSTLLHASAGYTGANFAVTGEGVIPIADSAIGGYFIGVGGGQAIGRNLSLKMDYRFSDYEDVKGDLGGVPLSFTDNFVHSLRVGANWKFH